MKKLIILAMMIGMLAITSSVFAVSIEPSLGILPVAGEAELNSVAPLVLPGQAYIDWIVFNPGAYGGTAFSGLVNGITGSTSLSQYLYVYQIEARGNPAITNVQNMTIYFDTIKASSAGNYNADLDTWHNPVNFANLGTEGEPAGGVDPYVFGPLWYTSNITWVYDGQLDATEESRIAWIKSNHPPQYTIVGMMDTSILIGKVPVPGLVPEPASMSLLGFGLLGLVGAIRKKFIA